MLRVLATVIAGALAASLVAGAVLRTRRSRVATTELCKHPERLDQMLDPTDDA